MASQNDINSIPKKYIPVPFANSAESAFINDIPQARASGDPQNKASWNLGFPPITMQPVNASGTGGIPPSGADMNGVLNALSSHAYIAQYGVSYDWDSNIASNLGGYPSGAIVAYPVGSSPNKTLYLSLQDNNTSAPNTSAWKSLFPKMTIYPTSQVINGNIYAWKREYPDGLIQQGGIWNTYIKDQNNIVDTVNLIVPYTSRNLGVSISIIAGEEMSNNNGAYELGGYSTSASSYSDPQIYKPLQLDGFGVRVFRVSGSSIDRISVQWTSWGI